MGVLDPRNSMQVCVRHCPTSDITSWQHAKDFATQNKSRLCRYDIDPDDYGKQSSDSWSADGPCPGLPVFQRQVFFIATCYKMIQGVKFLTCNRNVMNTAVHVSHEAVHSAACNVADLMSLLDCFRCGKAV